VRRPIDVVMMRSVLNVEVTYLLTLFSCIQWDPQRAQWNIMFDKLRQFAEEYGHCKVPKGYNKDPELANWVRNQRLEYANMQRNKKARMTQDRLYLLKGIGFRWSTPMPSRSRVSSDGPPRHIELSAQAHESPDGNADEFSDVDAPKVKPENGTLV
jgi:hypothetical protein